MQVYEPYMYIYIHAMQNNIIIKYCAIDLTRYRCLCIVTHIHIHSHTHSDTSCLLVSRYFFSCSLKLIGHALSYYIRPLNSRLASYSYQLGCSYHVV